MKKLLTLTALIAAATGVFAAEPVPAPATVKTAATQAAAPAAEAASATHDGAKKKLHRAKHAGKQHAAHAHDAVDAATTPAPAPAK